MPRPVVNVGLQLAHSPRADPGRLARFAERLAQDVRGELEDATRADWRFHPTEPRRLDTEEPRRPTDFLDEASLDMVEGPYDLVVVVTDVALVSRRHAVVAGLASDVSNVVVLSTRKLLIVPRGQPMRALEEESVRWNAAVLLLHLLGHVVGLRHARAEGVMTPFGFDPERRALPSFSPRERARLPALAARVPEAELQSPNPLRALAFHLRNAARHPGLILRPLLRSRAPLLTLSLPGLVTAALVPTFILIFTAEIWDVGLNMQEGVAWWSAATAVLAATVYLTGVQNLFFPRKEKRTLTAHMAVVNVTIFLIVLLAMVGLFAMLVSLMLLIEFRIFPGDLIQTWPTLEDPEVSAYDKLRLAVFVSTLAVLTGALAGGFEKREAIRHLALFEAEP